MLKERAEAGINAALAEAKRSLHDGGIPIGAALVDRDGQVIGLGHNRRLQDGNPMLHAEIDCLAHAGRQHSYAGATLYSTLMPCYMCAGAIVQFGIRSVVVGESRTFTGAAELMRKKGVDIIDLDDAVCRDLLRTFIVGHPDQWAEDIGQAE